LPRRFSVFALSPDKGQGFRAIRQRRQFVAKVLGVQRIRDQVRISGVVLNEQDSAPPPEPLPLLSSIHPPD